MPGYGLPAPLGGTAVGARLTRPGSSAETAVHRLNLGMAAAGGTAFLTLLVDHGLLMGSGYSEPLRLLQIACVATFAGLQAAKLLVVEAPRAYLRSHWLDFSMLFVLAVQFVAHLGLRDTPEYVYLERHGVPSPLWTFYIALLQLYLLAIVGLRSTLLHRALLRLRLRPAQMLVVSFVTLIGGGTLLLALPGATTSGDSMGLIDALFTATSAVCVTGLTVIDVGTDLSIQGQGLLLALIQAGGLGMLTITASFALFSGRGLDEDEGRALGEALEVRTVIEMRQTLGRVVRATLLIEAAGAACLWWTWRDQLADPLQRASWSLFHAISAFCNAGFALFPQNASLTMLTKDLPTNAIIALLIVLGGLGFGVLNELGRFLLARVRRLPTPAWSRHSRWVLGLSFGLIAAGTVSILVFERDGVLGALSPAGQWLAALFQSITLRTAGFNTVDLTLLGAPAVVICIVWMLIGGAPGSTAGGMKTTTVLAAWSAATRRPALDRPTARRALRLTGIFLGTWLLTSGLLVVLQGESGLRVWFESASALGTVGLSMGLTQELSTPSRLLLCLAMFCGRVGPFALVAALLPLKSEESPPATSQRILVG